MTTSVTLRGGCHCSAVQWQADVAASVEIHNCNCSICERTGFQHLIVPKNQFTLIQGRDVLQRYRFGTGTAEHLFCRICGIKSFYVPRSNPDGYSLNWRCVENRGDVAEVSIVPFDGQNWEENAAALKHLSAQA